MFAIGTIGLVNNGEFRVDGPGDLLELGLSIDINPEALQSLSGTGKFVISAGVLTVWRVVSFDPASSLTWEISGGTLLIEDICNHCDEFQGKILMTGGTLDVDADLCTEDVLEFENATIDVAAGLSAKFSSVCP